MCYFVPSTQALIVVLPSRIDSCSPLLIGRCRMNGNWAYPELIVNGDSWKTTAVNPVKYQPLLVLLVWWLRYGKRNHIVLAKTSFLIYSKYQIKYRIEVNTKYILHTTFCNSFSSVKMVVFLFQFHWFFPKCSALVQIMSWRRWGDKPLSGSIMA